MTPNTPDDLVLALGKRWREAYDNWLAAPSKGESVEETKAMDNRADDLGDICWKLAADIVKVPAFSVEGILVKLRVAAKHHELMHRNNSGEWDDTDAHLTWQAWDALERLAGEAQS